ncbi:MAG: ribonuclease R [Cytophagaceae bacterium]|jgi:ribonuclease R|nr:ribonuclease R [Cytophagaceae bacterium]
MKTKKKKNKKPKGNHTTDIKMIIQDVFFDKPSKTYNYKQVAQILGNNRKSAQQKVQLALIDLAESGFLTEVTTGRYKLVASGSYVTGTVDMTSSGAAYIVPEEGGEDIFVSQTNLKHALNGDVVKVLLYAKNRSRRAEGEVVEVVKCKRELFVGTLDVSGNCAFLVTDSKVIYRNIYIPHDKIHGANNGQKVIVKIIEWSDKAKNPIGEVVDILGNQGDNNAEMHAILAEFNLPYTYPAEMDAEAEKIPETIPDAEIIKRRDFRNITTFTIDPADAKDFDDALSIRKLDSGLWEIGVHIADVTHYVQPDTLIDREGYDRATSVYLVDRVVPMLPERLSNYLCSLRPNEQKLCFSAVFEMNSDATVKNQWFGRTVINSDRRFSYEEAQTIIETGTGDFADELKTMNTLAKKLRRKRIKAGAVEFERVEVRFEIDETGKPLSVFFKESKDSNKLIEEFMLLANRKVAELIGKKTPPQTFVYRIHDHPNPEKFETFSKFVRKFGLKAEPQGKESISQSINRLLTTVKGRKEQNIVETLAIRTMAKAVYSTHNVGHYGLAFKYYSHFTSPIRRYPDMMVHRLLQRYLDGGKSASAEKYEEWCEHSSEMEQRAADAERASIKYKQVEFLKDRVGHSFDGVISGVTEWGLYVELDENKCEGMIPIRDLNYDIYQFDEDNYMLVGRRTGQEYRLGDPIKIKIARANLEKRQLDFVVDDDSWRI